MAQENQKPKCGIVMPISSIDGCSAEHWEDVLCIIKECIVEAGFDVNLVSHSDDSGIIQKRIIQNLYSNEIVICDVSGKNPNVMFELGIRLAFDKPTIIIKDDVTDYVFDTAIIEHLNYPRDLRFPKIIAFKEDLKIKAKSTYDKALNDSNYTTFLKNFGEYKVAQLSETEVSSDKFILNAIEDIKNELFLIRMDKKRISKDMHNLRNSNSENIDKATIIVEKHVEEFLELTEYKTIYEIYKNGKKDELIEFLEDFDDVITSCRNRHTLNKIVDELAVPF